MGSTAAVVVALLLVLYCLVQRSSRVVYRDRPLEYWFSQTFMTMVRTNGAYSQIVSIDRGPGQSYGCYLEKPGEVRQVYSVMGTNCLPFLVKKLGAHDTPISTACLRVRSALHLKRGFLPDARLERGQAVTALVWINRLPAETMEEIGSLSKSHNPEVAASAKYVLQNCHKTPN